MSYEVEGSERSGSSAKMHGCIVCDVDDENAARNRDPDEKVYRSYYTEEERDEALERLYSGEAYSDHEETKAERSEIRAPRFRRRGNVKPH